MESSAACILMIVLLIGIGMYEFWYKHSDHVQVPPKGKLDPFATVVNIQCNKPSRKANYIKTTITFSDGFVFIALDTEYRGRNLVVTPAMKNNMLQRAKVAHRAAVEKGVK